MPVVSAEPVVTAACVFFCRRAMGCGQHPAFPAPSVLLEGRTNGQDSGANRAAGLRTCFCLSSGTSTEMELSHVMRAKRSATPALIVVIGRRCRMSAPLLRSAVHDRLRDHAMD